MVKYDKLWITMKKKNISQYKLTKEFNFSRGQIDRLKKNNNVSTFTINQLCEILDCKVEDIMEYTKD